MRPIHWLMLLLVLYAVASAAWSDTITSHAPLFALVDRLGLVPFLLFLIAPVAFRTEAQRRILPIGLVILGAYLGLMSLFEAVSSLHGLVVPSYILNPALGIHAGRSRGPFLEAGANGLAMFDCLIAGAITLPHWRGRPGIRALVIGVMIMCAAGIVFTLTRQVWVGAGVGAAVAMLCDRRLRVWLPFTAIGAAIVVVAALAFVPGLRASVNARANTKARCGTGSAPMARRSGCSRLVRRSDSAGATSVLTASPYYRLAATYPLLSISVAHNMPLSNAAELGLIGVGLWFVIMLLGIVAPVIRPGSARRRSRGGWP